MGPHGKKDKHTRINLKTKVSKILTSFMRRKATRIVFRIIFLRAKGLNQDKEGKRRMKGKEIKWVGRGSG